MHLSSSCDVIKRCVKPIKALDFASELEFGVRAKAFLAIVTSSLYALSIVLETQATLV